MRIPRPLMSNYRIHNNIFYLKKQVLIVRCIFQPLKHSNRITLSTLKSTVYSNLFRTLD